MATFTGVMEEANYSYERGAYDNFEENIFALCSVLKLPADKIPSILDENIVLGSNYYPESVNSLENIGDIISKYRPNNNSLSETKIR